MYVLAWIPEGKSRPEWRGWRKYVINLSTSGGSEGVEHVCGAVLGTDNQKVNFDNDNPITPIFKSDNDNYNTKLSEVNDNSITITTF